MWEETGAVSGRIGPIASKHLPRYPVSQLSHDQAQGPLQMSGSTAPPEPARSSRLHTAGAARLLFGAVAFDVARLGSGLRIRRKGITKVILSVLVLAVVLLSGVALAMLWALYQ